MTKSKTDIASPTHAGIRAHRADIKAYLVGGGIASLAAAALLIRDGDLLGRNIVILEDSDTLGGSLDGAGSPQAGYVLRGGRMFESKYQCTYDLFSSVPTLDKSRTVTQEIFAWNETMKTSSKARLVRGQRTIDAPDYGLSEAHIFALAKLGVEPEGALGNSRISDHFDEAFFRTNFWMMWCTTFAFQPWHSAVELKRYLLRFSHMVEGFNRLRGIMRTVYNQYDSLVRPLHKWLDERGVEFRRNTRVTDIVTAADGAAKRVERILCRRDGKDEEIAVGPQDVVIITLGSMTDASSLGDTDHAPAMKTKADGGAFKLWETIAAGRPEFGRPAVFADHIDESKWVSFTATLRDPTFFRIVRDITGNVPGEGGLVTLTDSAWLASFVLPHQPHFIGQPADVQVFWGYGLAVDQPGNFVGKPMTACSGREIFTEVLGHLGVTTETAKILDSAVVIPCMMPFITSQFLRREIGDRPQVLPQGWRNLALVGQFSEIPDDVVFTVEYSVRAAMLAVDGLLGLDRPPPAVYKGQYDPRVLFKAFRSLHDLVPCFRSS